MEAQFQKLGLPAQRWSAVDGRSVDVESLVLGGELRREGLARLLLPDEHKVFGMDLTPGALGCALSHMEVWIDIMRRRGNGEFDGGEACGFLVVEDDCEFLPGFSEELFRARLVEAHPVSPRGLGHGAAFAGWRQRGQAQQDVLDVQLRWMELGLAHHVPWLWVRGPALGAGCCCQGQALGGQGRLGGSAARRRAQRQARSAATSAATSKSQTSASGASGAPSGSGATAIERLQVAVEQLEALQAEPPDGVDCCFTDVVASQLEAKRAELAEAQRTAAVQNASSMPLATMLHKEANAISKAEKRLRAARQSLEQKQEARGLVEAQLQKAQEELAQLDAEVEEASRALHALEEEARVEAAAQLRRAPWAESCPMDEISSEARTATTQEAAGPGGRSAPRSVARPNDAATPMVSGRRSPRRASGSWRPRLRSWPLLLLALLAAPLGVAAEARGHSCFARSHARGALHRQQEGGGAEAARFGGPRPLDLGSAQAPPAPGQTGTADQETRLAPHRLEEARGAARRRMGSTAFLHASAPTDKEGQLANSGGVAGWRQGWCGVTVSTASGLQLLACSLGPKGFYRDSLAAFGDAVLYQRPRFISVVGLATETFSANGAGLAGRASGLTVAKPPGLAALRAAPAGGRPLGIARCVDGDIALQAVGTEQLVAAWFGRAGLEVVRRPRGQHPPLGAAKTSFLAPSPSPGRQHGACGKSLGWTLCETLLARNLGWDPASTGWGAHESRLRAAGALRRTRRLDPIHKAGPAASRMSGHAVTDNADGELHGWRLAACRSAGAPPMGAERGLHLRCGELRLARACIDWHFKYERRMVADLGDELDLMHSGPQELGWEAGPRARSAPFRHETRKLSHGANLLGACSSNPRWTQARLPDAREQGRARCSGAEGGTLWRRQHGSPVHKAQRRGRGSWPPAHRPPQGRRTDAMEVRCSCGPSDEKLNGKLYLDGATLEPLFGHLRWEGGAIARRDGDGNLVAEVCGADGRDRCPQRTAKDGEDVEAWLLATLAGPAVEEVNFGGSRHAVLDGRLAEAQRRGSERADRLAVRGAQMYAVDKLTVGVHQAQAGFARELGRWIWHAAILGQGIGARGGEGPPHAAERRRARLADAEWPQAAEEAKGEGPSAERPRLESARSTGNSSAALSASAVAFSILGHALSYACAGEGEDTQEPVACSKCGAYMTLVGRSGGKPRLKERCPGDRTDKGGRNQRSLWLRGLHPGGRRQEGSRAARHRVKGEGVPTLRSQGPVPEHAQERYLEWLGTAAESAADPSATASSAAAARVGNLVEFGVVDEGLAAAAGTEGGALEVSAPFAHAAACGSHPPGPADLFWPPLVEQNKEDFRTDVQKDEHPRYTYGKDSKGGWGAPPLPLEDEVESVASALRLAGWRCFDLVGDWDGWSRFHRFRGRSDGCMTVEVDLPPGEQVEFQILCDEDWDLRLFPTQEGSIVLGPGAAAHGNNWKLQVPTKSHVLHVIWRPSEKEGVDLDCSFGEASSEALGRSYAVVGSWDRWQSFTELRRDGQHATTFTAAVEVPAGEAIEFQLICNGQLNQRMFPSPDGSRILGPSADAHDKNWRLPAPRRRSLLRCSWDPTGERSLRCSVAELELGPCPAGRPHPARRARRGAALGADAAGQRAAEGKGAPGAPGTACWHGPTGTASWALDRKLVQCRGHGMQRCCVDPRVSPVLPVLHMGERYVASGCESKVLSASAQLQRTIPNSLCQISHMSADPCFAILLFVVFWPRMVRPDYAVPPEDIVSAVEPYAIERPATAHHEGTWTFYPPESHDLYGQYVYTSPMGKSCAQNLTIHLATWMCATGYNEPEYLNSGKCIPNAYELVAFIVDTINNGTGTLNSTCVQLSAHHYDFTKMALQRISEEFVEASRKWPAKNGFVTGGDGARADQIARTAAVLGVPHMEVHAQAVVISDLSQKPTFFQTRSAANWLLPGMMEMVPGRFALLVDTASAPDMIPAFQEAAARAGRQIVSRVILPVFDGSDPNSTVAPTEDAIDLFLASDVRYIVLGTSTAASYAVLGCRLYLRGEDLYRRVQLLAMATPGDVLMSVPGCSEDVLRTVIENGGMVASVAWPPNPADDILINRATGEGYQGGGSWGLDGTSWADNGLGVRDTQDCADDPEGASISPTVLALLGKTPGDSVSCAELVPFGQTGWQPYMQQVAQYCPVSACNWNSLMPGCRISCACSDGSLTMPDEPGIAEPGGPLCVDAARLPADWLPSSRARCDGAACRRLAFGPSGWDLAMQFWEYSRGKPPYWENASVRAGFCANPHFCRNIPPWAVHFGVGLGVVDGVYALAKAWECVESRHGAAGLDRVVTADPRDYTATNWVISCLKEDVSFEGAQGRINFKYPPENPHSPTAGYTFANVLGGTRTKNNEQAVCGYHTNSSAVVISRVISREDYTACEQWEAEVMPGRTCPEHAPQAVLLLDDNSTHDLLPLAGPSSCGPGESPLTLGSDPADIAATGLDHCMACPAGRYKPSEGPEACQDCAAGRFADSAGAVQCGACPAGQRSGSGAAECQNCSAGTSTYRMAGEAECRDCEAGTHAPSEGSAFCADCPVGSFQPADGSPGCSQCTEPRTTQYPRARSSADCLCPAGTYLSSGVCAACPEAMDCAFGSDEANFPSAGEAGLGEHPKVREGFMSRPQDALTVYYCSDWRHCPGGAPGTCATGRDARTVACGECLPEMFETEAGTCEPCENVATSAAVVVVITIVLLIAGVITLTFALNRDVFQQTHSKIAVVILAGFTFSGLQVLSVFNNLAIEWFEPVESLLHIVAVLTFELRVFRTACVFSGGIVVRFLCRQLVAPSLVVVVFLSLCGKRRWKNPDTRVWGGDAEHAAQMIRSFFRVICVAFSTSASDAVLDAQADAVVRRIPRRHDARRDSKCSNSSSVMEV
ncbi:unnamed protein product [Prorocentrum cordatum]|uniref:Tyrosine-protein kinase ephrin type A/B receptor-like domain-containing protein n=1 Tax=Prorocentrum cordatum TaxID=2364126 RepID=A0ABN9SVX4_9DINO|nr:unnamed protein product [Polarella glacialis]